MQNNFPSFSFPSPAVSSFASFPSSTLKLDTTIDKPKLRVNLNNNERGYYSSLLSQADPVNSNSVQGKEAVAFFKRSGLSVDLLKKIWLLSSSNNTSLDREEFYVALRLIAYAQNNIEVSADSILKALPASLPKFATPPTTAPQTSSPSQKLEEENSLPANPPPNFSSRSSILEIPPQNSYSSFGAFDAQKAQPQPQFSSFGNFESQKVQTFPSSFASFDTQKNQPQPLNSSILAGFGNLEAQKNQSQPQTQPSSLGFNNLDTQKNQPQPQVQPQGQPQGQPQPQPQNKVLIESEAKISLDKLHKYESLYKNLDLEEQGFVTGGDARDVFLKSGLSNNVLFQIWNLVDSKKTGNLNKGEFIVALHLIVLAKQGYELPKVLPKGLEMIVKEYWVEAKNSESSSNLLVDTGEDDKYKAFDIHVTPSSENLNSDLSNANNPQIVDLNNQNNYNYTNINNANNMSAGLGNQNFKQEVVKETSYSLQSQLPKKENNLSPSAGSFGNIDQNIPNMPQSSLLEIDHTQIEMNKEMARLRKIHTSVIEEKTNDLSILNTILSNYQKFLKKINEENQFMVEESKKIEEQKSAAIKSILSLHNNVDVALSRNLDLKQKIVAQSKYAIQEIAETSKNTIQTVSEGGCIQPKTKMEITENKVIKKEEQPKTNFANEQIPNKASQEKKVRFENLNDEEDFGMGLRNESKIPSVPQQKIAETPNIKNDSKNMDNMLYNNSAGQNNHLKQSLAPANFSPNNLDIGINFQNLNPQINSSNKMELANNNPEQKNSNVTNVDMNQNFAEPNNFEGMPMNSFINNNSISNNNQINPNSLNNNAMPSNNQINPNSLMNNNTIDIVNKNMTNIPNNKMNNNLNNNMMNNFDLNNNTEENMNGWNNHTNAQANFESPQKFDFGMGNNKNDSPQTEVIKQISLKQMDSDHKEFMNFGKFDMNSMENDAGGNWGVFDNNNAQFNKVPEESSAFGNFGDFGQDNSEKKSSISFENFAAGFKF